MRAHSSRSVRSASPNTSANNRRCWRGARGGAFLGVGKGVTIVLSILGYVVLTPVLTVYLLIDFDRLIERAKGLIPYDKRDKWLPFMAEYDFLLSRYLRGQMTAALIAGILTWLGLWILGFPYPALVGAVAGVFNLVPYLGLVVSLIPAVIISLLSGNIVGGAADALIQAVADIARERGWSLLRWITAENNYRARGVYDRLAQRTDWVTYDMKL